MQPKKYIRWIGDRRLIQLGLQPIYKVKENRFNKDFKDLIEKRVKIVHQKLVDQNNEAKVIKDFKLLVEKRVKLTHNKLMQQKINQ